MARRKIAVPNPDVPLVDPATGKIKREWFPIIQQLVDDLNGRI